MVTMSGDEYDEYDEAGVLGQRRSRRLSQLAVFGAMAAVLGMVATGLVVGGGRGQSPADSATSQAAPKLSVSSGGTQSDTAQTGGEPTTTGLVPTTTLLTATLPTTLPARLPTTTTPPATTTAATAAPATTAATPESGATTGQALAIVDRCLADLPVCTQLASTADGRIVAHDRVADTLTVLDETGQEILDVVDLPAAIVEGSGSLLTIGPNDVAYMGASGDGDAELVLFAVPFTGARRGEAVIMADGLDGSGDSDLVSSIEGLATVGCCGFDRVRPGPEAAVIPWLDDARVATATFRIELGDGGNNLVRIGPTRGLTSWALPTAATSLRGMPTVVPTDDGGALMSVFHEPSGTSHVVRFDASWPEYRTDNTQVFHLGDRFESPEIRLLEPSGTVIVAEGGALVRKMLDQVGSAGWVPNFEFDVATWSREAIGLNEYITAEQPSWAVDPDGLAFQLAPEIGAAESFNASFDDVASELTVEVSNFLDDSVFASRTVWPVAIGDDGLLRVGVGSRSQQCQPGRGHQDFQAESCV